MIDAIRLAKKEPIISQRQALDHNSDIYQELSAYLEPLIDFLPEKYAVPLKMADLQGLKLRAIAGHMGLSLTAVKSRVSRARKMLKSEIHSCFHIQSSAHSGIADFNLKQSCRSLQEWQKEES